MKFIHRILSKIHPRKPARKHYRELVKPEPLQLERMRQDYFFICKSDNPVIFDCGANKGDSIQIFLNSHPNAIIHAFEPDPTLFDKLEMKFGNINNVNLERAAVWHQDGAIKFYSDCKDSGSCVNSENRNFSSSPIMVPAIRLKSRIQEHEKLDFLKLDIEGSETNVISDCGNFLSRVDRLFVEYHSFLGSEQELSKILALLEELNFKYQLDEEWNRRANRWIYEDNGNNMDCQVKVYAINERVWRS